MPLEGDWAGGLITILAFGIFGRSSLVALGRLGKLLKVWEEGPKINFEGDSKTTNPVVTEKRVNPT